MCAEEPILETKDRCLCFDCVDEEFLRAEIKRDGQDRTCFYCKQDRKTFSIDQVANFVCDGLSEFFDRPEQYPPDLQAKLEQMARDRGEEPPDKGRRVADVIKDEAGICETAAEDVRRVLAERYQQNPDLTERQDDIAEAIGVDRAGFFDAETHYVKRKSVDACDFEGDWDLFDESLKRNTRYFNRTAEQILTTVFEGIDNYETNNGRPLVVDAGPGTELAEIYRARYFQTEGKLKEAMKRPDMRLGPPPSSDAVAGRMNAAGIAVFYGATSAAVALAEVRPPVGSKVLVGCFKVVRALRLLDLEALEFVADEQGSIFDTGRIHRLKRGKFLRGLCRRISRPVMPDDQPRDYIPTQAVADFLATLATPPLDGILYPSVQVGYMRPCYAPGIFGRGSSAGSRNVVLFHKAAGVQALDIPEGTDISVSYGGLSAFGLSGPDTDISVSHDPEVDYTVFEKMASAAPSPGSDDAPLKFSTLEVHHIRGVKFETVCKPVHRYPVPNREADEGKQTKGLDNLSD